MSANGLIKNRKSRKDRVCLPDEIKNLPKLVLEQKEIPINTANHQNKLLLGSSDYLLSDFDEEQRDYIIKELYPSLKQGLI